MLNETFYVIFKHRGVFQLPRKWKGSRKIFKTVEKSFQLEANDEILTKLVQLLEGEIKKQETAAKLIS